MCTIIFDFTYAGHKFSKGNFLGHKGINLKTLEIEPTCFNSKGCVVYICINQVNPYSNK